MVNGVLRYGHFGEFLDFFGDRMANLGLTDFKLDLCIKVNLNVGQTYLKFNYLKTFGHQLAQNRSDATFGQEH